MNLSDREKEKLARLNSLNAILSNSSIEEAAQAARQREVLQARTMENAIAREEQRRRDEYLEAGRNTRSLRSAEAMNRLTAAQLNQLGDLGAAQSMTDELLEEVEGTDDLGGATGFIQSLVGQYAPDAIANLFTDNFVSDDRQGLQAKAAALYTLAVQSMQKGVLSDQDFRRVQALNITDPSLSKSQLQTRLQSLQSILNSARSSIEGPTAKAPTAPTMQTETIINFEDLK